MLPLTDHKRIYFFIRENGAQARAVVTAIVHEAFHNLSFLTAQSWN